jgi:hypothetical protein
VFSNKQDEDEDEEDEDDEDEDKDGNIIPSPLVSIATRRLCKAIIMSRA